MRESNENLTVLSISCNSNITNDGLIYLSEHLHRLNYLNIKACTQINDNLIYKFDWDSIEINEQKPEESTIEPQQTIDKVGKGLIFNKSITDLNIVRTKISESAIKAMERRKQNCTITY